MVTGPCTKCGATDWYYYKAVRQCRPCRRAWYKPEMRARQHRKDRYGLTPDAYEALQQKAAGYCLVCGRSEILYIDHSHETGKVRGLICHKCNVAAGMLSDSSTTALRLAKYLAGGNLGTT